MAESLSVKPGLRIDFMELRRLGFEEVEDEAGCWGGVFDSERESCCGCSISVAEKDRLRDGERKELGDNEGRFCVGDGYDVIGGRRLLLFKESG
jgi:hypothetical protein